MATFIISGSRGTDDPTMATLPFMAAKTAKEQGHDVVLWLWNEAVTLGRKGTADHVTGVGSARGVCTARSVHSRPLWSRCGRSVTSMCSNDRVRARRWLVKRWCCWFRVQLTAHGCKLHASRSLRR